MRHAVMRKLLVALAIAAPLCLLSAPSLAGDRPWEQERWATPFDSRGASPEDFTSSQPWQQPLTHAGDRHAVTYPNGLSLNLEKNLTLSIQSPLIGEWAPSLAFEFRF